MIIFSWLVIMLLPNAQHCRLLRGIVAMITWSPDNASDEKARHFALPYGYPPGRAGGRSVVATIGAQGGALSNQGCKVGNVDLDWLLLAPSESDHHQPPS